MTILIYILTIYLQTQPNVEVIVQASDILEIKQALMANQTEAELFLKQMILINKNDHDLKIKNNIVQVPSRKFPDLIPMANYLFFFGSDLSRKETRNLVLSQLEKRGMSKSDLSQLKSLVPKNLDIATAINQEAQIIFKANCPYAEWSNLDRLDEDTIEDDQIATFLKESSKAQREAHLNWYSRLLAGISKPGRKILLSYAVASNQPLITGYALEDRDTPSQGDVDAMRKRLKNHFDKKEIKNQ